MRFGEWWRSGRDWGDWEEEIGGTEEIRRSRLGEIVRNE